MRDLRSAGAPPGGRCYLRRTPPWRSAGSHPVSHGSPALSVSGALKDPEHRHDPGFDKVAPDILGHAVTVRPVEQARVERRLHGRDDLVALSAVQFIPKVRA